MTLNGPDVLVVSLGVEGLGGLCAGSSSLGNNLSAFVVANKENLEQVRTCGANTLFYVERQPDILYDDYFSTIFNHISCVKPGVVILKASRRERCVAARLAAKLKVSLIPDVSRIWIEGDSVLAEHMVFGGSAFRVERCAQPVGVVTLAESSLPEVVSGRALESIAEVSFVEPPQRTRLIETKQRAFEKVNLASAKKVVSIGRGLAKQEDLRLIEDLAASIGAEVGCTRPVAEGLEWMSRERYIGVSGAMLNADLFVAIGLSGQVQHMVGANNSKLIFAINKDKNAMIFKQTDYGIVGDLNKVLPKIIELMANR